MAKARNYFGLRTGSTKSKTFSILNGWQIEKDRVYGGKNPRTNAQMRQRMVMATASAAYSGMREICDHSFEGVTYGQPTMSKFISENAKMLQRNMNSLIEGTGKNLCAYNPYQDRNIMCNPYIVSKGTLKPKSVSIGVDDLDDSVVTVLLSFDNITEETTLADWFKSLGVSINGFITLMVVANSPEIGLGQFGFLRISPKPEALNGTVYGHQFDEIFDIESNVPVLLPDGDIEVTGEFAFGFDFDQGFITTCSSAFILSDKKIAWVRSNAQMTVYRPSSSPNFNDASTVIATYPVGTDYVLNGGSI